MSDFSDNPYACVASYEGANIFEFGDLEGMTGMEADSESFHLSDFNETHIYILKYLRLKF